MVICHRTSLLAYLRHGVDLLLQREPSICDGDQVGLSPFKGSKGDKIGPEDPVDQAVLLQMYAWSAVAQKSERVGPGLQALGKGGPV